MEAGEWVPLWTALPKASKEWQEIIKCRFITQCHERCTCTNAILSCKQLYNTEGHFSRQVTLTNGMVIFEYVVASIYIIIGNVSMNMNIHQTNYLNMYYIVIWY